MKTEATEQVTETVEEAKENLPGSKWLLLFSALVLLVTGGVSGWVYWQGDRELRVKAKELLATVPSDANDSASKSVAKLVGEMKSWALQATAATATSGLGMMTVALLGFACWRRTLLKRFAEDRRVSEEKSQQLSGIREELEREATERKRVEEELRRSHQEFERRVEERTASLARSRDALEDELNSRKQAEKQLASQAKELERSKDVLELHVQARTQELQKLKSRYEHILNSAGEGIYGLDIQGKTTFVNPAAAKLTGWKVEELVGKLERDMFHRQDLENNTEFKDRHGEHLAEIIFYRKDGASFPVEYVRTPITEKEKVVGAVVIFKDITERKRTEETLARKAAELARSNAELEQFAYVASHDLQEPLRKIQAFGDRLKSKVDSVQMTEGRDYLERMQNAAARMQTLINDLLTFSRVISTSQPFVPVDLSAVTKEVLGDLEVRIERTKARVEVGQLATIEADPLQMRQLLQNLIGNALKFQPPNHQPVVSINAEIVRTPLAGSPEAGPLDEVCELKITDNGIGFEEKYLEKIFAVFQRLHGRTEYEGTGVGLAVCRRITDRHGGTITASSKPGQGATFVVRLPVRHPKGKNPA